MLGAGFRCHFSNGVPFPESWIIRVPSRDDGRYSWRPEIYGSSHVTYLPDGPARSTRAQLDEFWAAAKAARPDAALGDDYQVRWIGLDDATTQQIFELIASGDKTGTFTLPWIIERTDQPEPAVGDCIILIAYDGTPTQLVRLTDVQRVNFGEISATHTAIDGSPVRALEVWKPLHTQYWNTLLAPWSMTVSPDMPVLIEPFELLYPQPAAGLPGP